MHDPERAEGLPPRPALTEAGPVPADVYWERIAYFLERVVPVAEEHKVRLACHPHDPGMPPGRGYWGVHTVLGSVEGLKRFVDICPSPYHGLNFCQGTVSEMLEDPGRQIFDVIRYFGGRKRIFNVHFVAARGASAETPCSHEPLLGYTGGSDMRQRTRAYLAGFAAAQSVAELDQVTTRDVLQFLGGARGTDLTLNPWRWACREAIRRALGS